MKLLPQFNIFNRKAVVVPTFSTIEQSFDDRKQASGDSTKFTKGGEFEAPSSALRAYKHEELDHPANHERQLNKEMQNGSKLYTAGMFDVWAYGISTVIGGHMYGWNVALDCGFGSFFISVFLMGFSFLNLTFALAEIISTTSFSGGAYGMARIVLGFYAGFIVASFELMEYICYISFSALYIVDFICNKFDLGDEYAPLVCLAFYLIATPFVMEEDRYFWRLNYSLALFSFAVLLVYCFGCLGFVNFTQNASLHVHSDTNYVGNWFAGGMAAFMQALPYANWGFGGIETAALVTDMIDNPRINLSYGMALSVITLFACIVWITFVACSLPPGMKEFIDMDYFMNAGFEKLGIHRSVAEWLILPAQFAMAYAFFLPAAKLLHAMAQSNLIPHIFKLKQESQHQKDHRLATVYIAFLSYLICLLAIYLPQVDITNIPILLAQVTYLSDFYAFYRMRVDFSSRDFKFKNPFGIWGAAFSSLFFILTAISVIAFVGNYNAIIIVTVYFVLLTLGYFGFAKQHQSFSDDEQKSLMVLHVIKHNKRKKRVMKVPKKFFSTMFGGFSVRSSVRNSSSGVAGTTHHPPSSTNSHSWFPFKFGDHSRLSNPSEDDGERSDGRSFSSHHVSNNGYSHHILRFVSGGRIATAKQTNVIAVSAGGSSANNSIRRGQSIQSTNPTNIGIGLPSVHRAADSEPEHNKSIRSVRIQRLMDGHMDDDDDDENDEIPSVSSPGRKSNRIITVDSRPMSAATNLQYNQGSSSSASTPNHARQLSMSLIGATFSSRNILNITTATSASTFVHVPFPSSSPSHRLPLSTFTPSVLPDEQLQEIGFATHNTEVAALDDHILAETNIPTNIEIPPNDILVGNQYESMDNIPLA